MNSIEWLLSKFNRPVTPDSSKPIENVSPVNLDKTPAHLKLALQCVGKKEGVDDQWIIKLFKDTSYKTDSSSTAWCAAFICWLMASCSLKNTRSAAALGQAKLGVSCEDDQPGAIMVWKHLTGSLKGHHHVNVLIKKVSESRWQCVGGNQNNAVTIAEYGSPHYQLVASRRPVKA
jgi:uncharacterized protein (TIGR02594 family)